MSTLFTKEDFARMNINSAMARLESDLAELRTEYRVNGMTSTELRHRMRALFKKTADAIEEWNEFADE